MSLFSSKKTSYLGVDIGTASIKVVELKAESGLPRLLTYGYVEVASDIIRSNTPQTRQKIVSALKKVLEASHISTDKAVAALPTFSVFNSIITLPPMAKKDVPAAIKWEAKKYVPLPLEEMFLDWKILEAAPDKIHVKKQVGFSPKASGGFLGLFGHKSKVTVDNSDKEIIKKNTFSVEKNAPEANIRVLVTAAPKNLVNRYLDIFKDAGLKLLSLETEAFALARSLIGADATTMMVIDIGSITTDICIIENGIPVINRSIDVGGLTITQAIAASLNVNFDRAEQFKRDFGVNLNGDLGQRGILKTIVTSISPIVNEAKYVFDLYQQQGNQNVEKVVLAGGSAFLSNLSGYFSELFNKPTIIGNPWDRVVFPDELKPILEEIGPRFTVAIGLAMREIVH